jgi:hypothetical protein
MKINVRGCPECNHTGRVINSEGYYTDEPCSCHREHTVKEGDYFKWYFADCRGVLRDIYWCKSQICVYKGGHLRDTFWSGGEAYVLYSHNKEVEYEFTFLGNINDYEHFTGNPERYNKEDILNLNHSNNSRGNIYLRKGAKQSMESVKRKVLEEVDKETNNISYAQSRLVRLEEQLEKIAAGCNVEDVYY